MVISYYNRLSARQQSIYRQIDEIEQLRLLQPAALPSIVAELEAALKSENHREVERLCQLVCDGIVTQFKAPKVRIQVLAARPAEDWGELHGLYMPEEDGTLAKVQVWVRTAKHKKVVAFRSFLRTVLQEACHQFDYGLFLLPETL